MDVAEERIIDGNAIHHDQHARLGGWQAAHGLVVGGGMTDIRTDVVERQSRQIAQDIVERLGWSVLNLFGGHDAQALGNGCQRYRASRGRNNHGLGSEIGAANPG